MIYWLQNEEGSWKASLIITQKKRTPISEMSVPSYFGDNVASLLMPCKYYNTKKVYQQEIGKTVGTRERVYLRSLVILP